jgi:DNA-binding transcriptional LysR family regulator
MRVGDWDEIRTAFHVARLGTVSGAAQALGVHHATVIRHVDALERRLGVRLFQRHARGYTPTEAGRELMQVAQVTEDQFAQLLGRIRGRGGELTGELTVTAIPGIGRAVAPALAAFQERYPGVSLRYLSDARVFRLEYGEAHAAIRAGSAPAEPDNVVQRLGTVRPRLCAAASYIARHGRPRSDADLARHRFIGSDDPAARAPFLRWLREAVPAQAIVFRATEPAAMAEAVRAGIGLGFLTATEAAAEPGVEVVMGPRPEWDSPLWLVTHVDLHRTPKVHALAAHLKEAARGWGEL